jgi:DtxR family Mn-dependent transcriptional regulator
MLQVLFEHDCEPMPVEEIYEYAKRQSPVFLLPQQIGAVCKVIRSNENTGETSSCEKVNQLERIELSYSSQIYLNSIYQLGKRKGYVRPVDISNDMQVSKPSVTRAIKILTEQGMIDKNSDGEISLTAEGNEAVEYMRGRYETVKKFFYDAIGKCCVPSDKEVIRIAYAMSDEVIGAIEESAKDEPACAATAYFLKDGEK